MCTRFFILFYLFTIILVQFDASVLQINSKTNNLLTNHHNNTEVYQILNDIQRKCPKISYVRDLSGTSVRGLPLREIVFSDNPGVVEFYEPEFRFIANMHGNEVVGREMLLQLASELCEGYLNNDEMIKKLIDSAVIHLMPTMNPDGWDIAVANEWAKNRRNRFANIHEMLYEIGVTDFLVGRNNANDVDLNRNFPDMNKYIFKYNQNRVPKYDHLVDELKSELFKQKHDCLGFEFQPETKAVLDYIYNNTRFVLSSNLHGGDLVASYPYDDSPLRMNTYSKTPDDETFKYLARTYSKNHKIMAAPNREVCEQDALPFADGITNGAEWYPVCGGMQDLNYLVTNNFEITLELGCNKFPPGKQLMKYWNDNKVAMFEYMWAVHSGVKGRVTDVNGASIEGAIVYVANFTNNVFNIINHNVISNKFGEYWRLLTTGTYKIWAEKRGYYPSKIELIKIENIRHQEAPIIDFQLTPTNLLRNNNKVRNKLSQLFPSLRNNKFEKITNRMSIFFNNYNNM